MKPQRRPPEFFDHLSDKPVEIQQFNPKSKKQASLYCEQINWLLASFGATAELFGSVELEIATKGEWEFAIYLTDEQWFPVLVHLINNYGSIQTLMDDFAVFTDMLDGTEIEVIPMRGEAAIRNKAIMNFWRKDPVALEEYQRGKLEHAYSKREYYRWKDEYIAQIVERL
jgi:hypothetical protein